MQSKVKIGASEHSKCRTELNNALITNCDVHAAKYSDRSFDVQTG